VSGETYGAKCHICAHIRHGNEPVEVIGELKGLECDTCDFCAEQALHRLLMASGGLELFSPDTRAAVKAFHDGKPHPLLDQLRDECRLIEEANRGPEYVEFRGERWFVADARFDEADSAGHWHLTLTGGTDSSRQRTDEASALVIGESRAPGNSTEGL
jgi:hypothetical protein